MRVNPDSRDGITLIHGDSIDVLPTLRGIDIDCVITDPVWPNAPEGMFPGIDDPEKLLCSVLCCLPEGVKRLVLQLRNDCDPSFLRFVPAYGVPRFKFFQACWLYYVLPGHYGRKLGGNEIAYCYGRPVSAKHHKMLPAMCKPVQYEPKPGHPAARNLRHVEWLVEYWSEPGETILDPFAGSGTLGLAARKLGRKAVLIERDKHYVDVAANRLWGSPIEEEPDELPDLFYMGAL